MQSLQQQPSRYVNLAAVCKPKDLQMVQACIRTFFTHLLCMQTAQPEADGSICAYLGVYDGHGGIATSDWLEKNLFSIVQDEWDNGNAPSAHINKAFRDADTLLLSPRALMWPRRGLRVVLCMPVHAGH